MSYRKDFNLLQAVFITVLRESEIFILNKWKYLMVNSIFFFFIKYHQIFCCTKTRETRSIYTIFSAYIQYFLFKFSNSKVKTASLQKRGFPHQISRNSSLLGTGTKSKQLFQGGKLNLLLIYLLLQQSNK